VQRFGRPQIVLDFNYKQTDVPVPALIEGASQPIALVI
jgi:hypothetical protein